MRQRHNGFTNFMRKLEGKTNDDDILQEEGLGFRVHQGYECLLELLQSRICWRTYLGRVQQCSPTERLETFNLRKRIGLIVPLYSVGVYVTDRSYYFKTVEYLRQHQSSEQQEGLSSSTHGQLSLSNTDDVYIPSHVFDQF